jgi:hypothetical protein
MPRRRIIWRSGWVCIFTSNFRSDVMKFSCQGARIGQPKICGVVSIVARQEGQRSDSVWPSRFMCLRVGSRL